MSATNIHSLYIQKSFPVWEILFAAGQEDFFLRDLCSLMYSIHKILHG